MEIHIIKEGVAIPQRLTIIRSGSSSSLPSMMKLLKNKTKYIKINKYTLDHSKEKGISKEKNYYKRFYKN